MVLFLSPFKSGWERERRTQNDDAAVRDSRGFSDIVFAARGNLWLTVSLVSIAAAAHQGWSANVYTLASDLFPRSSVGLVVGLAGFGGGLSAGCWRLRPWATGLTSPKVPTGPLFLVAGSMYLIALGLVQLVVPGSRNRFRTSERFSNRSFGKRQEPA